ncbi:MAG TPA: gliding motility-associated protein GldE [Saprospiraceae bacterium]|nr:gliding motility-associated protein GldE [Saprospiraceae bacterium]
MLIEPDSLSHSFNSIQLLFIIGSFVHTGLSLVLIVLLFIFTSTIVSCEVSFFSLSHHELAVLRSENNKSSKLILQLLNRPRLVMMTLLICQNLLNITIIILAELLFYNLYKTPTLLNFIQTNLEDIGVSNSISHFIGDVIYYFISVIIIVFVLITFGEILPKVLARKNSLRIVKTYVNLINFLTKLLYPFSKLLLRANNFFDPRLTGSGLKDPFSIDELESAIELAHKYDKDSKHEMDILKSILKFGDVSVNQIMRSRVDVVAVDYKVNFTKLLDLVKSSGYSRIPVFDEDFDNVTGIIYAKDLLIHLDKAVDFEWQSLIRMDVLYVPESKSIDDMLRTFQSERKHIAIVVDEYGSSSGLITLEDIMEEVIGEIKDEFDDDVELAYKKIDKYNYIFDGKTMLHDVCKVLNLEPEMFESIRGDSESLAGLILEFLERLPKTGEVIELRDCILTVQEADNRRIAKIKVTLPKEKD